jgi:hypothetical protein
MRHGKIDKNKQKQQYIVDFFCITLYKASFTLFPFKGGDFAGII